MQALRFRVAQVDLSRGRERVNFGRASIEPCWSGPTVERYGTRVSLRTLGTTFLELPSMTRTAALRSGLLFIALGVLFGLIGSGSGAQAAKALFLVAGSMSLVLGVFAAIAPSPRPAPVRVRARR